MLELFASQILNGLAIGQVYALIALGFSLVFGVSNLINFARAPSSCWAPSSLSAA